MNKYWNGKAEEILQYAKMLSQKGYVSGTEGNLSCRLDNGNILITPSRILKDQLRKSDLVEIGLDGNVVRGTQKPSTERYTHIQIYRDSMDTKAIIHAHPLYTVLMTVLGENPFSRVFLSEAAMFLKNVAIVPFAMPSTTEGADQICGLAGDTQVLVIDRHGSFTYGRDLMEAFSLLEILEKYCHMNHLAVSSGREIRYLNDEQRIKLGKIL